MTTGGSAPHVTSLTIAMILDDVLHVAVLLVAQAQLLAVAVVLRVRAEDGRLGAVVLATCHEVLAIVGDATRVTQSFRSGRAEAVVGRSEIAAQTPQLVVVVLNARRARYANTVCVRGALFAFR